jgi:AraC-like DNA-binding protein
VTTADRQPPHHDTLTCYVNYSCRLPECIERNRAYNQRREAAKKAGEWQPYVNAEPVRQHLLMLAEHGITLYRAAEMAGVGARSLHPLFQPQSGRRRPVRHTVRTEIAEKVLAVTPDSTPGRVDPTGTTRRIQALVADGWPMRHLASHFGLSSTYVHQIVKRSTSKHLVLAATARKISDGYEFLKSEQPSEHGVGQRVINLSRNHASSRRWPPTSYWAKHWDDIDDPHFDPMYGVTRREIVAQDAAWVMRTTGLDKAATAQRLGVHKSYIDHAFRDHPQYAIEVAA